MVPWEPRVSVVDSFKFSQHSSTAHVEKSPRRFYTILVVLLSQCVHCVFEHEADQTLNASSCKYHTAKLYSPFFFGGGGHVYNLCYSTDRLALR